MVRAIWLGYERAALGEWPASRSSFRDGRRASLVRNQHADADGGPGHAVGACSRRPGVDHSGPAVRHGLLQAAARRSWPSPRKSGTRSCRRRSGRPPGRLRPLLRQGRPVGAGHGRRAEPASAGGGDEVPQVGHGGAQQAHRCIPRTCWRGRGRARRCRRPGRGPAVEGIAIFAASQEPIDADRGAPAGRPGLGAGQAYRREGTGAAGLGSRPCPAARPVQPGTPTCRRSGTWPPTRAKAKAPRKR